MAVEFPPSPAPKYSYAISASCDRGDRHTMEDQICVYRGFTKTGELDFVLLGLFDGHAGEAAAQRAKEILPSKVDRLIRRGWGEEKALRQAFHDTNDQLLQEMNTWSSCGSIPSRSGTTACVVLLRRGRLWTANCGDSTCVLGIRVGVEKRELKQQSDLEGRSWYPAGIRATSPHSLNARERARVARDGGQVAIDSRGDPRVVFTWCDRHCWARQSRCSHRKSHYPCLNIARSLGDFWSFSSETGRFAVSCDPDIRSFSIADDNIFACCLHSDGVALSPAAIMKTINASAFEDKENIFEERPRNHAMEVIIQNRHYLRSRPYRDNAAAVAVVISDSSLIRQSTC
ncbi:hypothetical protein Y032_0396g683 [Ancylostoma ceylanicum]|uniref:PPM-type phosphatase domain-containing protein n=1 Tax=Ancylostoma ceylanicum TaxID=53326 RepID=A0A016RRP3_9BILA|nr:hypothetical protein Y032_0396g683 [Ancylostoma ceylanicum]